MPQSVEGAYAFESARQVLGSRLSTSHVLDIGGGSLQIAGLQSAYGQDLGQKTWHRTLCESLPNTGSPCKLQPMSAANLQLARALMDDRFKDAAALGPNTTMTAISRPVTRGVLPAMKRLGAVRSTDTLDAGDLALVIDKIRALTIEETAMRTGTPLVYARYLLSDMLLIQGLLRSIGIPKINVMEGALNVLPALLTDDIAFRWSDRYDCYLERFNAQGPKAYFSDPETCVTR
jgi:exopolyphosphatase/pppGpp-phosphohydrolase